MRKIISFILVVLCSSHMFAENRKSRVELMDKVYERVYKYIKANDPKYQYYISYYFEEFDIDSFVDIYTGKLEKDLFSEYAEIIMSDDYPRSPEYSEFLFNTFESVNKTISEPQYEIWFGFPSRFNFITCSVYTYGDHKENMTGCTYTLYFFAYNNSGDIYMMDDMEVKIISQGYH